MSGSAQCIGTRAVCSGAWESSVRKLYAFLALLGLVLSTWSHARELPAFEPGGAVLVVPIEGTIDLGLAPFVQRALDEHPTVDAVVLDVDTFGGRVDAAVQIRDALLSSQVPVVAYVDRRAISAGALISLAADTILFAPGGSMGAATPIQVEDGEAVAVGEKMVSYMRAEMRATAEATERDPALAEAMVDADVEVPDVIEEGKLLTVTTADALELGLSDGTYDTLDDALEAMGLGDAERLSAETNWAESLARALTDPTVSGILMSLGVLGLMVELYHPGVGLPGAVGVLCLSSFFFGHMVVGLAGWEEVLIILVGLVALAVETFIIPGFGVAGILGLALVVAGLTMAMVGTPLDVGWDAGLIEAALTKVVWSLLATLAAMAAIIKFFPREALPGWLVLKARIADEDEPHAATDNWQSHPDQHALVGTRGVAETDLRLAGKARLDGRIVDVVSEHEYVRKGTPVRVVAVEGVRVVVISDTSEE